MSVKYNTSCFRERRSETVESLAACAGYDLASLLDLARDGNARAAEGLHGVLLGALDELDSLCRTMPETFIAIARTTSVWPGLLTCDADIKKQNAALAAKLNLGRDAGLNYSGKQWTRETPESYVALQLYVMVKSQREAWLRRGETRKALRRFKKRFPGFKRSGQPKKVDGNVAKEFKLYDQTYKAAKNLGPLSRANYAAWCTASWPTFIARYGEDFENHKRFAHYWRNSTYMEATPGNSHAKQLKRNAHALIRDAIKKKIKQSFRSIAPKIG